VDDPQALGQGQKKLLVKQKILGELTDPDSLKFTIP